MPKYLVTCACGRQLDGGDRTGGRVAAVRLRCDGRGADTPPASPAAESRATNRRRSRTAWGLRHGAMTVSLLAGGGVLDRSPESVGIPSGRCRTIDPVARTQIVDRQVTKMTPVAGLAIVGGHLPVARDDRLRGLQASGDRRDAADPQLAPLDSEERWSPRRRCAWWRQRFSASTGRRKTTS